MSTHPGLPQLLQLTPSLMPRMGLLLFFLFGLSATRLSGQAHDHGVLQRTAQSADSTEQSADSTAVVRTVTQFGEALTVGDSATVAALLLPEAVILEGGAMEDRQHYLEHHYPSDTRFLQAMTREPGMRQVHIVGDVAYVASTSRLHGMLRDRDLDLSSAELMVLHRTPDGWKVAALHWSSRSSE